VSIGAETGPPIGVQEEPLFERRCWGDGQPRFLNRQDSLPVSMISQ
jgi:hypothetical protein